MKSRFATNLFSLNERFADRYTRTSLLATMNSANQMGAFPQALSEGELLEYEERARAFLQHQLHHQPSAAAEFGLTAMPPPAARIAGPNGVAVGNVGAVGHAGVRAPAPGLGFLPPQGQFAGLIGVPTAQSLAYSGALNGLPTHGGGTAAAASSDPYANLFGYGGMAPAGLDPQQQAQVAAFAAASRGMAIPPTMVVPSQWLVQQQQPQQFYDPASGLTFHPAIAAGLEAAYARDSQMQLAAAQGGLRRPATGAGGGIPTAARAGATFSEEEEGDDGDDDSEDERSPRAAVRTGFGLPLKLKKKKKMKKSSKKNDETAPSRPPDDHRPVSEAVLTGRPPIPLWNDYDETALTEYQCVLRKQIELFEANEDDLRGSAQGRNTPIRLGQVGIRCRHCSGMTKLARARGAVYYSRTVDGVYQVAQNMSKIHFVQTCLKVPRELREKLAKLQRVNNRASGGKEYWLESLKALGIYEDGNCVRFTTTIPPPKKRDEYDEAPDES